MTERRFAPATQRNREAIGAVLKERLPESGRLLEIASGSGEHAAYFGRRMSAWSWQPSDCDAEALASIDAWTQHEGLANVAPALKLNVEGGWPALGYDAVFCANLIHIAPWSACLALLSGAARCLRAGGVLVTYGPYKIGGQHTAPSNQVFEDWLRSKDLAFGVRDLEAVQEAAAAEGLKLRERVDMPANNFCLIFDK